MTSDVVLTVDGLTVKHRSQTALDDLSFTLKRGEVLGIVGANGAGKSTLLKVLSGGITPNAGTITFADEKFTPANEAEALAIGVGYIPQRITVDEDQTVYQTMFRTSYRSKLSDDEKRSEANRLLKDNGVSISADEYIRDLVQAERTMVEILRLANEETSLILLDEVSATFNDHEISLVHDLIIRLSKQGRAIIYVSHRLDELQSLSNRIAVIRDGKLRSILTPLEADRKTITVEIFDTEAPVPTKSATKSATRSYGLTMSPSKGNSLLPRSLSERAKSSASRDCAGQASNSWRKSSVDRRPTLPEPSPSTVKKRRFQVQMRHFNRES